MDTWKRSIRDNKGDGKLPVDISFVEPTLVSIDPDGVEGNNHCRGN